MNVISDGCIEWKDLNKDQCINHVRDYLFKKNDKNAMSSGISKLILIERIENTKKNEMPSLNLMKNQINKNIKEIKEIKDIKDIKAINLPKFKTAMRSHNPITKGT